MAQCRAFFTAVRYREAAPDEIREDDINAAEAEIGEVLRKCGKTPDIDS